MLKSEAFSGGERRMRVSAVASLVSSVTSLEAGGVVQFGPAGWPKRG